MEKIRLIELLDPKEQAPLYTIVDGLVANKRLRDTMSSALSLLFKKNKVCTQPII